MILSNYNCLWLRFTATRLRPISYLPNYCTHVGYPASNNTAADEHRSAEVNIPAATNENGGRNAEENTSNVETPAQPPERHLNQVRDELELFVSPCFVHSDRGKINYCHITIQIGQQSQTTTEKENVPPRRLK